MRIIAYNNFQTASKMFLPTIKQIYIFKKTSPASIIHDAVKLLPKMRVDNITTAKIEYRVLQAASLLVLRNICSGYK